MTDGPWSEGFPMELWRYLRIPDARWQSSEDHTFAGTEDQVERKMVVLLSDAERLREERDLYRKQMRERAARLGKCYSRAERLRERLNCDCGLLDGPHWKTHCETVLRLREALDWYASDPSADGERARAALQGRDEE